jgi:hypothetical protein
VYRREPVHAGEVAGLRGGAALDVDRARLSVIRTMTEVAGFHRQLNAAGSHAVATGGLVFRPDVPRPAASATELPHPTTGSGPSPWLRPGLPLRGAARSTSRIGVAGREDHKSMTPGPAAVRRLD